MGGFSAAGRPWCIAGLRGQSAAAVGATASATGTAAVLRTRAPGYLQDSGVWTLDGNKPPNARPSDHRAGSSAKVPCRW